MTDSVTVEAAGRQVRISNPAKVFFAEIGASKLDLVRYYQAVADPLLAAMGGRPVLMHRFPDGAGGKSWFQKRLPTSAPNWLQSVEMTTPGGTTSEVLVIEDLAHVLWAAAAGSLGFHVWPNLASDLRISQELRIDLDPSPGVDFDHLRLAAARTRLVCREFGLEALLKTSGSRGLHVYVPLQPRWDGYEVRAAAVALARELQRRFPEDFTAQWWKEKRGARVFVDYNQNAPHKTMFGAWCVRPRPGGQVSTPLAWSELETVDPDSLTLLSVPARVAQNGNPWADARQQSLEPLLALAQRDRRAGLKDAPWPPQYPKMPGEPRRVQPSRARKER